MDKRVEITADDLEIDFALDQYYTFLKRVIAQTEDKVFLFNTITPFDIYDFAPLYNENVFANHADIVIGTSPQIVDESSGISLNDSFSRYYADIVKIASKKVERRHLSPEARADIKSLEVDIDSYRDKSLELTKDISQSWTDHAAALGLTPGTIEYDLEKINFYTNSGLATQLADIAGDILEALADIQDIKETNVPGEYLTLITRNYVVRAKEYKMYRPFQPQLEKSGQLTYIQLVKILASAVSNIGLRSIFEEGEQIFPFADLSLLYKKAIRGFSIKKGVTDVEKHDVDWSVSGSGSRFFVFKASANASYVEHVEESIQSLNQIDFSFQAIHDIRINRRDWYDTSIFDLDVVQETLASSPKLARNTRHVITSLIVGRGLTLNYTFGEKTHYERMKDFKTSVSGRVRLGFANFGTNGHYHQHDFKQVNTDGTQTITFGDEESVCRVLALRYEQIHNIGSDEDFFQAFNFEAEYDEDTQEFVPILSSFEGIIDEEDGGDSVENSDSTKSK